MWSSPKGVKTKGLLPLYWRGGQPSPEPPADSVLRIMCEGEKAAQAISRHYPRAVGVSYAGGSKAASAWHIQKEAWSRAKAIVWADRDREGANAAWEIVERLEAIGCEVTYVPAGADRNDAVDLSERQAQQTVKAILKRDPQPFGKTAL